MLRRAASGKGGVVVMFGLHGRILKVDLSTGDIRSEEYDEDYARKFLGGNGFAAHLVHAGVPAEADPLDAGNAIVFATGPLTDTPVWGSGRGHVAAISPLTQLFADSNFGGRFGATLKRTGCDAVYVTGAADRPVYLAIDQDGARIEDAADLWGKTTLETEEMIRDRQGRDAVTASIGPAGENRVLFANIMCAGNRPSAAGRCGMGAVMGAKNLKAVVASGKQRPTVAHPVELRTFLDARRDTLREGAELLTRLGTPFLVKMINDRGLLGTHNAQRGTFEFADDIGADVLKGQYIRRAVACQGCPVACGKMVDVPSGPLAGRTVKMPEYESIFAMGPMLDNRDIVSIINANGLCDLLGLDTISMGVTLAFVAECREQGLVSPAELGGCIDFGDGAALVELVGATARREGPGELLALGSERLADRFGPETRRCLYSVKGLELAGHSAAGLPSMALGYATSTRGGSHHDTRPVYAAPGEGGGFDGQAAHSVHTQNFTAVGDSLVMCRFVQERGLGKTNNDATAEVLNLVTGWNTTAAELEQIGERIYNLERLINTARGVRRKDDVLPHRAMHEPIPDGPAAGRYCPPEQLAAMLDEYYRMRGWTDDGVPTPRKLAELGL